MHFVNGTDGAFLRFDKFRVAVFDLFRAFDERGELIRRLDDAFFLGGAVLAEKRGVILPKLLGKPIQQLLAGVFFDLAIAFAQCAVIVFYRCGKIARYDLGHVVIKRKQRDALGIVDDPFLTDAEKDAPDSPRVKPEDDAPEVSPEVNLKGSPAAEEPAPVSEQPALKVPPLPGQEQAFTAGMPVGEKKESSLIFSSPIFWKR